MTVDNNKIFDRVWRKSVKYGLAFISSNGGTGKTTYFKFRLLRDAVERNIPFHIYVRYSNQMEIMAQSFIDRKGTYSKRQCALLDRCEVYKESDKFIYIVERETGRKLAQILNVYGQAYYKPFGNTIHARRALFDEVLAENGEYCPDEINKFNRLVFTMARADEYHVFCLYNNTSPNFDYFTYYGGQSFNTHVAKSGALFIYFTARQFDKRGVTQDDKSIQAIIQKTAYNDVYNNNTFVQFPAYHKPADLRGSKIFFKLEIENRLFKVREVDGTIYLDDTFAYKRSHKPVYSVNDTSRTTLKQLPDAARYSLSMFKSAARLKAADINNTVFVKILCDKI